MENTNQTEPKYVTKLVETIMNSLNTILSKPHLRKMRLVTRHCNYFRDFQSLIYLRVLRIFHIAT